MAVRHHRHWIWPAIAIGAVAVIIGLAGWALNPASLKPRLIEAAERATGRTMTISGRVAIKLSLVPTVSLEDVALSNPPGFSRPDMMKADRVELGLALLPLLRHQVVVDRVTVVRPDVLLETGPSGRPNWVFGRQSPPAVSVVSPRSPETAQVAPRPPSDAASNATPNGAPKREFQPTVKEIVAEDGQIGWLDPAGHRFVAAIQRLTLTAPSGLPAAVSGTFTYDGRAVEVTANTGPLDELRADGARTVSNAAPWPLTAKLASGGATVALDAKVANPAAARGYAAAIDVDVPDPSILAQMLPRLPLNSLKAVTIHAEVADGGGATPTISALRAKVGSIDLDTIIPDRFPRGIVSRGAMLEDVTVTGSGNSPLTLSARLASGGLESGISGTAGDLAWLASGRAAPISVDLAWKAASARASIKGTIQEPRRFSGLALDVAVDMPDPSLAIDGAPSTLKSVVFRTHLSDGSGASPFQLTSNAGDLEGQLSISRDPRLSIVGSVASRRLDLDILLGRAVAAGAPADSPAAPADLSRVPGGSPPAGSPAPAAVGPNGVTSATPSPDAPSAAAPSGSPTAGSQAAQGEGIFSDVKLPFGVIRAVDGRVGFTFAHVLFDGADVRRISGVATAKDGQLRVDPFNIAAPDQRMNALLVVDAAATPASVHLSVDAPGLALRPLLLALGLPPAASGNVELQGDVTATGDSPRALAATIDGWAGVAVEGGQLDSRMVNSWLAQLQPLHIGGTDSTDLRCFAMRANAKAGVVTVKPMAMNTAALIIDGSGTFDLGQETLSLRLRPRAKIGGTGISVPIRVTGRMRDPTARIDISPGGGALAGLLLGGKDVMGAQGGGDPCPDALIKARESGPPGGEEAPRLPRDPK